jgi:type I restriction enzyme S subunit
MKHDWQSLTLRQAGVALIDCEHRTPPASIDGFPYIAIPQIKNGRLDLSDARKITTEHFENWTRKAMPQPFDVVLSRRCNPGETAFIPPGLKCALGQNLVLLRASGEQIYPPFLRWLARGSEWWGQVERYLNMGAVFESLKCADVPNFEFSVPPIDEQRAIARVLGALDDKIELNRRMNRTLEELASALFRSWFVDFDPVVAKAAGRKPVHLRSELAELFPDTFQDSDLGPIPKGWQVLPLGDLCTLKRGYDLAGAIRKPGNVPVISSAGFKSSHSEAKVKGPGVITGRYGTIGDVFFVEEDFWPLNTTLYVQDFKGHPVRFIFHALQGIDYGIYSDKAAVPGINRNDLHQEKIICPPAAVESEFDRLTDRFWKQHSANERESRTLAALRDTLLPKLLSGELRVKPAEKLVEATA